MSKIITNFDPCSCPSDSVLSFSDLCHQWLSLSAGQLKTASYVKYESMLRLHILPFFAEQPLQSITTQKIAEFSHILQAEKHLSPKSVRDILTLLHLILYYIERTYPGQLPAFTIFYPREPRKKLRVLTPREQQILTSYLAQEPDIYKAAMLLALSTGLRIGEVCGLRWGNFSFEQKTISVEASVQRIRNLNPEISSKTILLLGTPKTAASVRTIPLTDRILRLCRSFRHEKQDPSAFFLTGSEKCGDPRTLQRHLRHYTQDCQLEDVHFHTLRHTFATRCIETGCDMKTLSELLGHSNVSITMNRYVHPGMELKRQNIERMEDAIFAF